MRNLIAGWSLTDNCNLKCLHCYNNSGKAKPNELTTGQAFAVAKLLVDANVAAVNFGGGECPLRADFFDVCRFLDEHGIKLSLTTNGLTSKLVLPHLSLFNDIGVSIDFADKSRHDYFRGKEGAFELAVTAVKEFVSKGANVEIVTCLTKMNCSLENLKAVYELAKELKVKFWRINRYRPTGRDNKDRLSLSKDDLRKAYSFFSSLATKDFVMPDPLFSLLGKRVNQCPCGTTSFRIQSNGDVTPCIYLHKSGGNILDTSLEQIFESEIFRAIRHRDLSKTKCGSCTHLKECHGGCAGFAYLVNGTFNEPDPLCWIDNDWNVHEKYLCTAYIPIMGE